MLKGLLKACVSGQEKFSFCNQNSAAAEADFGGAAEDALGRKKKTDAAAKIAVVLPDNGPLLLGWEFLKVR